MCRKCQATHETIQHITSGCTHITHTEYKHRHDQVAKIIHQKLAKQQGLVTTVVPYYKYSPEVVLENNNTKIYWDRTIITDRTIHHNRPDIIMVKKEEKSAYIIDIAIPNTHNIQTTYEEKITKYADLAIEMERMWKLEKVITVPIILSSTGVIPKTLSTNLTILQLPPFTYIELQKATILNTCRIVRQFLGININNK